MTSITKTPHTFYVYGTDFSYNDKPAIDPLCLEATTKALSSFISETAQIIIIKNKLDLEEKLKSPNQKNATLVIPGGRFGSLQRDLKESVQKIKIFIALGGGYLGICSGAILACREIITSSKEEGLQNYESAARLNVIPAEARLSYFKFKSDQNSEAISDNSSGRVLKISQVAGDSFYSFWKEGPVFSLNATAHTAKIEAYYGIEKEDIAALTQPYGLGKVAVIGFHPEFNELQENHSQEIEAETLKALQNLDLSLDRPVKDSFFKQIIQYVSGLDRLN